MIEWIEIHYKLLAGIIVPIIVAIIGIFKFSTLIKKNNQIKGNNNQQIAESDISQSFNKIEQKDGKSNVAITGNNNQVSNFDMQAIQILAQTYNTSMYPHAERAFEKFHLNSNKFLERLNSQLEGLSQLELDNFSESDVQMALREAIKGAGRTESSQVHDVLAKLVADRVQKTKCSIVELTLNEAIEVASKLDENLIKILAFSFLFSRTKYRTILNEDVLFLNLSKVAHTFKEIDATISKFEYLEALSCGKITQFQTLEIVENIFNQYPQLFLKEISEQALSTLNISSVIKNICFLENENGLFKLNPDVGLYLFEDIPLTVNGSPYKIEDNVVKENIKAITQNNRLTIDEVRVLLNSISSFDNIINTWDKNGFNLFSLTAVGIAIGRAYLEQKELGNYDINIWIK